MCTDGSGNSVICGPRGQLRKLIETEWDQLSCAPRFNVERPQLLDLAVVDHHFEDPESPAVAVVHHAPGVGIPFTRQLQVELVVGSPHLTALPELICEPGFTLSGTHGGDGIQNGTPQVELDPAALTRITNTLPHPETRYRSRVALLDTGVDPGQAQVNTPMIDFVDADMHGVQKAAPADPHGHGTAMAKIIQAINPGADISPIRVLNAANRGQCFEVLIGLQYALYSEQFDCVTACLAAPATVDCASSLGRSIEWMLGYWRKQTHIQLPIIIAAGGNGGPRSHSQYLAQMPNVVVAMALDEHGQLASYNSQPPPHSTPEHVFGGTVESPVGTIGQAEKLWGTSVAAAALTAAHLPAVDPATVQFRQLKRSGVTDPDIDWKLAFADSDATAVAEALSRGANTDITDVELLARYGIILDEEHGW